MVAGLIFLNICGCAAAFIVGAAAGGVGMYAVGKDTIQGDTDKPYDGLWDAALAVAGSRGAIKQEDYAKGYLELEIEGAQVWLRLIRMTQATTRLRISARKHHFPNLGLAQDIFTRIIDQAAG